METEENNLLTRTILEKGFTAYRLKSNPDIVLYFPKKYGIESKNLADVVNEPADNNSEWENNEKWMRLMEDKNYLTNCANLAKNDFKTNTGIEKKKAGSVYRYLKRALRELEIKDEDD